MTNNQQQSAHDFVVLSLGSLQHKILKMVDGVEENFALLQKENTLLKQLNEELKKKISELSPVEKV